MLACGRAGEPLPVADNEVDVVWAGEVIEHVVDVAPWLSELRRVLRPRGTLLLTTPNHGRATMLGLALSPRRFDAHFEPRSDHLRFFSTRTLRALLHDLGFDVTQLRVGAGHDPRARPIREPDARPARHDLRPARAERHRRLPRAPRRERCATRASRSSRPPTISGPAPAGGGAGSARNLALDLRWTQVELPRRAREAKPTSCTTRSRR